jgi:integrase
VGADAAGETVIKSFYGRTKDESMAKAEAWMQAHPNGPPTPQQSAPLSDIIHMWLTGTQHRQTTLEDYAAKIDLHIAPTIGRVAVGSLRLHEVNLWVQALAATGKGRTAEKCLGIVSAALDYAVANGIVSENVAAKAQAPDYERRKAQPLTLGQFRAFLEAAAGRLDVRKPYKTRDRKVKRYPAIDTRLEAAYVVLLYVGLRRGELLALRWSDLRDGVLHVERQIDRAGRERQYTKTERSRRAIELDDLVLDVLGVHQSRMQTERHDQARLPDGLIFPTSEGVRMHPSNLDRHFKGVLAAAGLPGTLRLHDLRHTTGKTAEAAGVPIAAISAMLGHSSTAITQKLYGHGDHQGVKAAQVKIGRKVKGDDPS